AREGRLRCGTGGDGSGPWGCAVQAADLVVRRRIRAQTAYHGRQSPVPRPPSRPGIRERWPRPKRQGGRAFALQHETDRSRRPWCNPAPRHDPDERKAPCQRKSVMSNPKDPKQTENQTVKPDDDSITSRNITPDELERVKGGINSGAAVSAPTR